MDDILVMYNICSAFDQQWKIKRKKSKYGEGDFYYPGQKRNHREYAQMKLMWYRRIYSCSLILRRCMELWLSLVTLACSSAAESNNLIPWCNKSLIYYGFFFFFVQGSGMSQWHSLMLSILSSCSCYLFLFQIPPLWSSLDATHTHHTHLGQGKTKYQNGNHLPLPLGLCLCVKHFGSPSPDVSQAAKKMSIDVWSVRDKGWKKLYIL